MEKIKSLKDTILVASVFGLVAWVSLTTVAKPYNNYKTCLGKIGYGPNYQGEIKESIWDRSGKNVNYSTVVIQPFDLSQKELTIVCVYDSRSNELKDVVYYDGDMSQKVIAVSHQYFNFFARN